MIFGSLLFFCIVGFDTCLSPILGKGHLTSNDSCVKSCQTIFCPLLVFSPTTSTIPYPGNTIRAYVCCHDGQKTIRKQTELLTKQADPLTILAHPLTKQTDLLTILAHLLTKQADPLTKQADVPAGLAPASISYQPHTVPLPALATNHIPYPCQH